MGDMRKIDFGKSLAVGLLEGQVIFFPEGLLGFASNRHFVLSRYQPPVETRSPFFLLQAQEGDISFPLIFPHLLKPDFQFAPSREVLTKLCAGSTADLIVMVIVTLRDRLEEITVNLQGPLLLNPVSKIGLQYVLEQYPVRFPLLKEPLP